MTTLTLTDAKVPAIVARALESALTSGVAAPRVTFGPILANGRPAYNALVAQASDSGWSVLASDYYLAQRLTTEQAGAFLAQVARRA